MHIGRPKDYQRERSRLWVPRGKRLAPHAIRTMPWIRLAPWRSLLAIGLRNSRGRMWRRTLWTRGFAMLRGRHGGFGRLTALTCTRRCRTRGGARHGQMGSCTFRGQLREMLVRRRCGGSWRRCAVEASSPRGS